MYRAPRLALFGAATLLALSAAPAFAQEDAASTIDVVGVDYAFTQLPTSVPAGTELTFTNGGTELHEMVLARVGDDVTETLDELLGMEAEGRDPVEEGLVEIMGGGQPLFALPGQTADGSFTLDQEGRYVVLCFIPQGLTPEKLEAAGVDLSMLDPNSDPAEMTPEAIALFEELQSAPPHMALGMVQEFQVTATDSTPGPLPEAASDGSMDEAPESEAPSA